MDRDEFLFRMFVQEQEEHEKSNVKNQDNSSSVDCAPQGAEDDKYRIIPKW